MPWPRFKRAMISVVIPTFNDAHRLVACLEPLVPASMAGVVRELIVVDGGSDDQTLEIAEDAGAVILSSADVRDGLTMAKGPWILVLDPAVRLEFGWEGPAKRHMEDRRTAARFGIEKSDGGLFARLVVPPIAAHLIQKVETSRLRLVRVGDRLEARIGQVHRLGARGRI